MYNTWPQIFSWLPSFPSLPHGCALILAQKDNRGVLGTSFRAEEFSEIGHVRYINIQAWLRGFRVKIANFSSFFCLSIPTGDLDTKKTTPNIDVRPESLGPMLEYWYIERGLLSANLIWRTILSHNMRIADGKTMLINKTSTFLFTWHIKSNVPVKSKLKHPTPPPPRAYPGHLTSFPTSSPGPSPRRSKWKWSKWSKWFKMIESESVDPPFWKSSRRRPWGRGWRLFLPEREGILGVFHLPKDSGNSGRVVNGTWFFGLFYWKISGKSGTSEKVVPFSRWKFSDGTACSIYGFPKGLPVPGRSRPYLRQGNMAATSSASSVAFVSSAF